MLDLVGDMRITVLCRRGTRRGALLDHAFVNLAGCEIIAPTHLGTREALVMAKIKVGFGAVLGHEYFPVLERAHGSRIHVDVRIQLEHRDFEAARFKNCGEGGGSDTFA
jgi:hypothetical protein